MSYPFGLSRIARCVMFCRLPSRKYTPAAVETTANSSLAASYASPPAFPWPKIPVALNASGFLLLILRAGFKFFTAPSFGFSLNLNAPSSKAPAIWGICTLFLPVSENGLCSLVQIWAVHLSLAWARFKLILSGSPLPLKGGTPVEKKAWKAFETMTANEIATIAVVYALKGLKLSLCSSRFCTFGAKSSITGITKTTAQYTNAPHV